MEIQALILSAALVVPMALAGQSTNQNTNQTSSNSAQLSNHDRMFLHTIASEDQSEIDLAKLALQKSTDPQVQQYAKSKILAADPSMKQGAKQVAQQNHATLSANPDPMVKAQYNNFSKLSGNLFDRAYVRYESKQQNADLVVVKDETATATNPDVRSYAQREETPVQQAAQAAQQLAHSMNIAVPPPNASSSGSVQGVEIHPGK